MIEVIVAIIIVLSYIYFGLKRIYKNKGKDKKK